MREMLQFILKTIGTMAIVVAGACLLIAWRNGAISADMVDSVIRRVLPALLGVGYGLFAVLPLNLRGKRVPSVTWFTGKPMADGEVIADVIKWHQNFATDSRRRDLCCWLIAAALLAAAISIVAWWQIFAHGDIVASTWALSALVAGFGLGAPVNRPAQIQTEE